MTLGSQGNYADSGPCFLHAFVWPEVATGRPRRISSSVERQRKSHLYLRGKQEQGGATGRPHRTHPATPTPRTRCCRGHVHTRCAAACPYAGVQMWCTILQKRGLRCREVLMRRRNRTLLAHDTRRLRRRSSTQRPRARILRAVCCPQRMAKRLQRPCMQGALQPCSWEPRVSALRPPHARRVRSG